MAFFPLFRKKEFFTKEEKDRIIAAIHAAEHRTSGEIRVYIESKCRFVDPLDRAAEIFWGLKMDQTADRNAVLVYVAIRDRQYAIYADKGIHEKVGEEFWREKVASMQEHFKAQHYLSAIIEVIEDIGEALYQHFPYQRDTDKNELPDDIVFGN